MTTNSFRALSRRALSLMPLLLWAGQSPAALTIPDSPLFLSSTGVKPNILMTFDDSGSMGRGYAPESVIAAQATIDGPRFKAASVNGLYYNPFLTYPIPTRSDGVSYTTSFTTAYFNGFDTSKDSINLSSAYKVIGGSDPNHDYSSDCSSTLTTGGTYNNCRFVKHPASVTSTTVTSTCTNVFFNDNGTRRGRARNDEIQIQGTGTGCSTFFNSDVGSGSVITITNAGSYNGDYTVTSRNSSTSVSINNAFTSDYTDSSATLSYTYTTSSGGGTTGTAAYYYLYYTDKPGQSKPASCPSVPSRANDNCYVKVLVNSTSGQDRDGNGTISAAELDERQNFANWYSFYRTRALAVMSGAMSAVTGLNTDSVRLGWQTINSPSGCSNFGTTCKGYDGTNRTNRIQKLTSSSKTNFYNWLARINLDVYTPLRSAMKRAGTYFTTSGRDSPYAEDPYVSAGTEYSCRKNFHVMFTDGLWNSNTTGESSFDTPGDDDPDSTNSTTLPDGNTYTPMAPYKDVSVAAGSSYSNSDSLSDTAFYYWAHDLRGDLVNKVAANIVDKSGDTTSQYWNPKNDPATWQHMTNYTIGLGLSASLKSECLFNPSNNTPDPNNPNPGCPEWGGNVYGGDYDGLIAGTLNWPKIDNDPNANEEPDGHVYELWHTAINSRGKFYSADNPSDLVSAFKDVMDTISSIASDGGGAGFSSNTTQIGTNTAVFEAKFNGDWSGSLQAVSLQTGGDLGTAYWEASSLIPYAADRNIYTINGNTAQAFTTCSGNLQTALNKNASGVSDSLCSQRLAWLRGYEEVTGATWASTSGGRVTFTVPSHGFANGNSVTVSGVTPNDYNGTYSSIAVTDSNTFTATLVTNPGTFSTVTTGKARYSGFRDRSTSVLGDIMNSNPIYAYIENYGYDGGSVTLTGHDSYASYVTTKASRTPVIAVGANDGMLHGFNASLVGANAGKELFAYVPAGVYDNGTVNGVYHNLSALTDPAYAHQYYVDGSPTVGDAYIGSWKTYLLGGLGAGGKSVFALDISDPANFGVTHVKWEFSDAADLGYTYSQPQIAPDTSTRWAAIFGNGYNSTNDKALLYVVNLATGTTLAKVATNNDVSNGLATPYLYDSNGDKVVDVVYAGDLKGHLWKFVNTSGTWSLGNGGLPLFTTQSNQPITSQPRVAAHPNGGVLVYFGTGRYITTSDLTDTSTQSFYAIWDNGTSGTVPLSKLQQQSFTTASGARTSSTTVPNWTSGDTQQRGWYMNFPTSSGPSERILSSPLLKNFLTIEDRVIFVTTIPTSDPCDRGGGGWLMQLNLVNGTQAAGSAQDTNGDGVIDALDVGTGVMDLNGDGEINADDAGSGMLLPSSLGIVPNTPLWVNDTLTNTSASTESSDAGMAYLLLTGSKGAYAVIKTSEDKCVGAGCTPAGITVPPTRVYWQQIM